MTLIFPKQFLFLRYSSIVGKSLVKRCQSMYNNDLCALLFASSQRDRRTLIEDRFERVHKINKTFSSACSVHTRVIHYEALLYFHRLMQTVAHERETVRFGDSSLNRRISCSLDAKYLQILSLQRILFNARTSVAFAYEVRMCVCARARRDGACTRVGSSRKYTCSNANGTFLLIIHG